MDGTVLVADDDRTIRTVLTQALTRAGCRVQATSSLTTLLRWISEGRGDAVITDVMMPDGNGLEMLPKISEERPDLPVIVISAQNTIMTAIKAAEVNAFEYLPKPFDLPKLMKITAKALEARNKNTAPSIEPRPLTDELPLVGKSAAMQKLFTLVAQLINSNLPLILTGESGTGKTVLAHVLHEASARATAPVISLTERNLEALADPWDVLNEVVTGTLLIEDVARLSQKAQSNLIGLLNEAPQDGPRFIATTSENLGAAVTREALREDIFFRLNGAVVEMPSLRDRLEDIPLLTEHFSNALRTEETQVQQFSDAALSALCAYDWPGNVRQLENVIARLSLTHESAQVDRQHIDQILSSHPDIQHARQGENGASLSESITIHLQRYFDQHGDSLPPPGLYARILKEMELPLLKIALDATSGNQARCAKLLGINRNTLRKKNPRSGNFRLAP